jgi:hypothetical protein
LPRRPKRAAVRNLLSLAGRHEPDCARLTVLSDQHVCFDGSIATRPGDINPVCRQRCKRQLDPNDRAALELWKSLGAGQRHKPRRLDNLRRSLSSLC